MLLGIIITYIPLILAIIIHELAHGYIAYICGDDTAKSQHRLSFNPIRHIDIIGTLIIPTILLLAHTGFIFGWAKPIPINLQKLKNPSRDIFIVSVAGIVANITLAVFSALLLKLIPDTPQSLTFGIIKLFLLNIVIYNIILAVFNSIPIPPLDGSKILLGWSKNPKIWCFLNSYREGIFFIILFTFVIPIISSYFGIVFHPLGTYLIDISQTIISWII